MILKKLFPNLSFSLLLKTVLLILFIASIGCTPEKKSSSKRTNVILIIVDALRPDHLRSYGYQKNTSPNLDRLIEDSTLFKTCVTPFPRTTPSAVSIATGMYPHTHGTRSTFTKTNNFESLENLNLAEVLQDDGYTTAAFLNCYPLHKNSGFQQGFATYVNLVEDKIMERTLEKKDKVKHAADKAVTTQAISWLEKITKQNNPFFLQLWYSSPHFPYYPPAEDLKLFSSLSRDNLKELYRRFTQYHNNKVFFMKIYNDKETELLLNAYDGEIYFADREIGRLIDYLKQVGLYDDSIIVFASDHGESMGEHEYYFSNGEYYYDVTALVPLIIKKPHQTKKEVITDYIARTIDIFPTILSALNISHTSEGENLFPKGKEDMERLKTSLAFGESGTSVYSFNKRRYLPGIAGKWRIARSNTKKLIFIPHPQKNIFEFYDVENDPYEKRNQINRPSFQSEIKDMKKALFSWIKKADLKDTAQITVDKIDPDMRKRLKTLGYLQ